MKSEALIQAIRARTHIGSSDRMMTSLSSAMLLIGFVFLAGSFFVASHFIPWTGFQHEVVAAVGAVAIGVGAMRGSKPFRWPAMAWAALAIALVPLAQWLGGLTLYRAGSILSALYLVTFALSVATGARLASVQRDQLLDALAATFLFVALASSIIAAAQWLGVVLPLPDLIYNSGMNEGRTVASLGQPNHLATCLALGLIGAGWLHQRRLVATPWFTAAALLIGFALVSTQSRVGLLMVLLLVGWCWYARRRAQLRLAPVAVVGFAAYVFALAFVWSAATALVGDQVSRDLRASGVGMRPLHWQYMLEALRESPWLGYGWGELSVGVGRVAHRMPLVHEMSDYAHNIVLDLLMWNGVPLGLLIVVGVTWWIVRHIARLNDAAVAFMLASVLCVALHSMVEFPHAYMYYLVPIGLMIGAMDQLAPVAPELRMTRTVHTGLLALATATGLVVAVEYVRIDLDLREMRLSYMGLERRKEPQDAPQVIVLDHLRAILILARTSVHDRQSDEQLASMARTVARSAQPPLLVRYAVIAARHGDIDAARSAMDLLCKVHSHSLCVAGFRDWVTYTKGDVALESIDFN